MSRLRDYLKQMPLHERHEFAKKIGTTLSTINRYESGGLKMSPARCVKIEKLTNGAVSRRDLRPDDYHEIWIDLIGDESKDLSK